MQMWDTPHVRDGRIREVTRGGGWGVLAVAAALLALTGCGQPANSDTGADAGVDSGPGTDSGSGTDATTTTDSGTDAGFRSYTYSVVAEYPHDPSAFTQGLVIDAGELYEGTGLFGGSTVRHVDLATGNVLDAVSLSASYFGEGITVVGNQIVQLTWQSNEGFVWDKLTLAPAGNFAYPTEGWGLTYDGTRLIMSDGTSTINFLDPGTYQNVGSINVTYAGAPVVDINELEYIDGEIYANIWHSDVIMIIDPMTGNVVGDIDLTGILNPPVANPEAVLNGIAYDSDTGQLYVTGKLWPTLFEIQLVPL